MEIKDIENLAKLSRIELSDDEKKELLGEMDSILGFVEQIQKVETGENVSEAGDLVNVMRSDEDTHESGVFTDDILAEVPKVENGFVKVKKIL
ncbi:MAG: Asp-tRNA(Asn)/Glu-tRNA(Gln) amidotransferase subunit GatC [Candidatus Pacebacteria bacterium]|nr:Asp-tRNA(Asn)/Glu-tRNA(Gln) amidotransferase subunit GatC [Candidatus Paceibacterota bacterium]